MRCIRYIFLGATRFSEEILNFLIDLKYLPIAIFYIPEKFKISWSDNLVENVNYADLKAVAIKFNIPFYEIDEGKKLRSYQNLIKNLNLDLILVMGFYYMIPKSIRDLSKYGAWGIHASLLPKYAGGAPLVWAIIKGEKETGVTLFKLSDGVDDGDIIAQKKFTIEDTDTISEVYKKATIASKEILSEVLEKIDKIKFIPQDKEKIEIWPQRKPEDGLLDWNQPSKKIYDFIRAQTKPYPCAFSFIKGKKIKFIKSSLTNIKCNNYIPGQIVEIESLILVATQDNFIKIELIEYKNREFNFQEMARKYNLVRNCFEKYKQE